MRTCKGTGTSAYDYETTMNTKDGFSRTSRFLRPVSNSSQDRAATLSDSSSCSPSPRLPGEVLLLSPPSLISDNKTILWDHAPDPSRTPNAFASWTPTGQNRRHSVPEFPTPISQRIHISQYPLLSSLNSVTATASPSSFASLDAVMTASPENVGLTSVSRSNGPQQLGESSTMTGPAMDQPYEPRSLQIQGYLFGDLSQATSLMDHVRYQSQPFDQHTLRPRSDLHPSQPHHYTPPGDRHSLGSRRTAPSTSASTLMPIAVPLFSATAQLGYHTAPQYDNMVGQQQQRHRQSLSPSKLSPELAWPSFPSMYVTMPSYPEHQGGAVGVSSHEQEQRTNSSMYDVPGPFLWNDAANTGR